MPRKPSPKQSPTDEKGTIDSKKTETPSTPESKTGHRTSKTRAKRTPGDIIDGIRIVNY